MAFSNPTVKIEAQLSFSTTWTDLSADLISSAGLTATRGKHGAAPLDCIADTGRMTFALDNSKSNSAGQIGRYSPFAINPGAASGSLIGWKLGIPIRLSLDGQILWVGCVDSIDATPDYTGGDLQAHVICVDWMDLAARQKIVHCQTIVSATSVGLGFVAANDAISALLTNAQFPPLATSIDAGSDVYPFALDTVRTEQSTLMSELQKIAQSELGFIYIEVNGTLVFKNRSKFLSGALPQQSFLSSEIQWMTLKADRSVLVTDVRGSVYPRSKDAAAVVLYQAATTMTLVASGGTVSFTAKYTDPNQKASRVGGTGVVAPTPGVDIFVNASSGGGGASMAAFLGGSFKQGGDSADVVITNTSTSATMYVTQFQIRGQGLYTYSAAMLYSSGSATTTLNTVNEIVIDMPYQSNTSCGQIVVDRIFKTYNNLGAGNFSPSSSALINAAVATAPALSFLATTTSLKDKASVINIGTYIQFQELVNQSATSAASNQVLAYYVRAIDYDIDAAGLLKTTLFLFRGWTT